MRPFLLTAALFVAGCDSGPPVPTEADNRQLDAAEQMLDAAPGNLASDDANRIETDEATGSGEESR